MSLNSKQIREIKSLYESVYAPKSEDNDLHINEEEFLELCELILVEYFQSNNIEVLNEGRPPKKLPFMKQLKNKLLGTTTGGKVVRALGVGIPSYEAGKTELTGGAQNIRTVLAGLRNAPNIYTGLKNAVKNNMKFDDITVTDRKTDYTYTGDQLKKKEAEKKNLKNSYDYTSEVINLVISERTSEDIAKEKNDKLEAEKRKKEEQEKEKKRKEEEAKKAAELEKKELSEPDFDDPDRKIDRGGTKDQLDKIAAAEKKRKEEEEKKRKAAELEKKELSEPDFDDPERKIGRGGPTPKPIEKEKEKEKEIKKDDKKNEIKKDKPKQYSTPVKDKTGLGSPIKPIKPGSARDIARARNEIRHGADHVGKLVNKTADFKAYKRGDITKQQFADKYPNSQTAKDLKKSKLPPSVMDFESYQPYDLVLDYIITEGHADTVEEAHYVMTQMDAETIQTIIAEYEIV